MIEREREIGQFATTDSLRKGLPPSWGWVLKPRQISLTLLAAGAQGSELLLQPSQVHRSKQWDQGLDVISPAIWDVAAAQGSSQEGLLACADPVEQQE